MVKIHILTPGKDKDRWLTEGIDHYRKLLSRYASLESRFFLPPAFIGTSPEEVMKKEAVHFEKELKGGLTVALSERGREYDSITFSKFIERIQVESRGTISFLIGGAFGAAPERSRKSRSYCFSLRSDFSHQLVRLILAEQLYRAFSILHGSSYHK